MDSFHWLLRYVTTIHGPQLHTWPTLASLSALLLDNRLNVTLVPCTAERPICKQSQANSQFRASAQEEAALRLSSLPTGDLGECRQLQRRRGEGGARQRGSTGCAGQGSTGLDQVIAWVKSPYVRIFRPVILSVDCTVLWRDG